MDQLVNAAASSGEQGFGPVIIQTTEGPCILISPDSYLSNEPQTEDDKSQVPVYVFTQPEELNQVPDCNTTEKENESAANEHSYTKSTEETDTDQSHLPLSLGSTSYVIANRGIVSDSQFTNTFRICDGNLQAINTNHCSLSVPSSEPKPILKLIKREPQTPDEIINRHPQHVSSLEAGQGGSVARPQPKSPKKIVRLYNPSDGGHKTFVITTNGQSKKQTFVTNGSSKKNFPLKTTATLVHLNEKGDAVVKRSRTSSSSEASQSHQGNNQINSRELTQDKLEARPVLVNENDVKVEPLSPPGSPGKLTTQQLSFGDHETAEYRQFSLPLNQTTIGDSGQCQLASGVDTSHSQRTNNNVPTAALGSPPESSQANAQGVNDVSCHTLSETLMNAASSSSTATLNPHSQSTAISSQTLAIASESSSASNNCPPPIIRRFILTSSSSSSTIQTPCTVSTAPCQLKLTSLQTEGTHPSAIELDSQNSGFDPGPRDDSLTNIQWLRKMSGQNLTVGQVAAKRPIQGAANSATTSVQIIATEQQIEQIGRECGTKKRPPYSYMHLIQMAISSKADKRMTLREIYKWIEDKFPYYRFSTKQGWKNSIRHNLSLYNIFVREKPYTPGRTGSSYWTLRSDLMDKGSKNIQYTSLDASIDKGGIGNPYVHVIGKTGSGSKIFKVRSGSSRSDLTIPTTIKPRKGPAPLLPKLPPPPPMQSGMQTFAIIPLPAGMSVVPPQPVVMSSWPVASPSAQNHLTASSISFHNVSGTNLNTSGNLKRMCNLESDGEPYRKHVKIAPKASILDKSSSRRLRATSSTASLDTSDLRKQLSNIHVDSGIASDMSSCDSPSSLELPNRGSSAPTRGLPKPTMFRNKRSRKDKVIVLRDCDEEISMSMGAFSSKDSSKENRPVGDPLKSSIRLVDIKSPLGVGQDLHLSLNESAFSESGFNDLLASIEKDFSSPMKGLLVTPPKPDDNKRSSASTPFSSVPLSPSWISPIKNVTPLSEDCRQIDSGFFTPDSKLTTSTPNGEVTRMRTSRRTAPAGPRTSPRLGSLRDLGLPGLTPLKASSKAASSSEDPGGQGDGDSPNTSLISNQSFQKLLGDLNLDSMMDDGVVDLGNLSFLQC